MRPETISAEVTPKPNKNQETAAALERLGLKVLYVGRTISVEASKLEWESIFGVSFSPQSKTVLRETNYQTEYQEADSQLLRVPRELADLVQEIAFVEPPEFF